MIPLDAIREWRAKHPWPDDAQVEQDLVISRALVDIYSDPRLTDALAFRGGTALHKLSLAPPARHSVDIDLVQVDAGGIGPILDALREVLGPWLGTASAKPGKFLFTLKFHYEGVSGVRQTLKVEINTREHGYVLGPARVPFTVENQWYRGSAAILTYSLEELLATKLRALERTTQQVTASSVAGEWCSSSRLESCVSGY